MKIKVEETIVTITINDAMVADTVKRLISQLSEVEQEKIEISGNYHTWWKEMAETNEYKEKKYLKG
jgi:hypothetical protein